MDNEITLSQIYVLDQDETLDFCTKTLGLELADDLDLGFMRWLTVRVQGDPGREILLELIGPPAMDEATAEPTRDLLTKGAMGGWLPISTDDAQAVYDTLSERGVDINDELAEKPYGIEFGIRDPFGNAIRIGQLFDRGDG
jgi:catechol 2,3-dioxygenase-like lactoylglutathione lyase family enzyme